MRFVMAVACAAVGLGGSAAMAGDVSATSAIDSVVVFPSGAEITRRAKVDMVAGEQRVIFGDLPAQAIAASIRVEASAQAKLEIASIDTRRLSVPRSDPATANAERRRLEDEIEVLGDQRALVEGQLKAAETQKALLANLAELPKVAPPQLSTAAVPDWKAVLSTIGAGTAEAQAIETDAQIKIRRIDRQINDLKGKLGSLSPIKDERTEAVVIVKAPGPAKAELVIRYQVSSASWTALYDARLATGSATVAPQLDLTRLASITQSTGEAWSDVALALSTTRPSTGASAPELVSMSVDYQPEAPPAPPPVAMTPAPMARSMKSAVPMGAIADSAEGGSAVLAQTRSGFMVNADVVQAPFQAVFTVPGRVTVGPNGEAKRVQLMQDQIEPQLTARTVPKVDAKAYLYAKLTLPRGGAALLPGAVSLFRDGTFVGTGRLPLLAPGEDHELGFGADDAIRVKHAIAEDKRGEKGLLTSSKTDTRNYRITIKNLHERAVGVTVHDQLPVSQQQDIKVTLSARPTPTKTDVNEKRGVLAWELRLEPSQEQIIEFGYEVVWPTGKAITYR